MEPLERIYHCGESCTWPRHPLTVTPTGLQADEIPVTETGKREKAWRRGAGLDYGELRAKGICTRCKHADARPDRAHCAPCAIAVADWMSSSYRKKVGGTVRNRVAKRIPPSRGGTHAKGSVVRIGGGRCAGDGRRVGEGAVNASLVAGVGSA